MVDISPNGVCYDLENTPYVFIWREVEYHFSSIVHMNKYMREVRKREEWLCDSLSRRFYVKVDACLLADLQLYSQIEKRGYYIVNMNSGEVCKCRGNVKVDTTI